MQKLPGRQPGEQSLPSGLTRSSIILGLKSKNLDGAVGELVTHALHGAGPIISKSQAITKLIQKRIKSSKLDPQSGVIFISSRIPQLPSARVALGIAPGGLQYPAPNREPIYTVFLSLLPKDYAGTETPVWARRCLGDKKKSYQIKTAPDMDAVLSIFKED
ncbi:MAG: hypothetical protein COT18_07280 [Elusimicrobia bacterium CG08_land_8_20_14_0_20_59_10]|nr:MAG: hypothetical protein COT18_07280 [Elusimicrobia bacterium CG08_land_8_20_14_0_20_59_10]